MSLGKASRDDQPVACSAFFMSGHLEDCLDGLLLGFANEAAGVDEDHLGVLGSLDVDEPRLFGNAEHDLAVDPVLDAPEAHQVNGFPPSGTFRDRGGSPLGLRDIVRHGSRAI